VTEPVLTVAWLVLAHLIADFILQNDWIAMHKGAGSRSGWSALAVHGAHVGLCLLPAVLAWGMPGLAYLVLVVASHMAVDRWKVRATRSADARAQAQARARIERGGPQQVSGLGAAWSPMPGLLFLADQVFHLLFAILGWLVILAGASLAPAFVDALNAALRDWDRSSIHAAILTGVILLSLFIVNTRGAFYFVLAMASPRDVRPLPGSASAAATPETTASEPASAASTTPGSAPASAALAAVVPTGAPARVAGTIAAFERLLVVAFVMAGAQVAVAAVIVFDLVARFRQLEDRRYAEHYLLSTFASLSVAVGSALVALAALNTLA
jgi:hypothetical protein